MAVDGSKNAALPLLAATVAADRTVQLFNVPHSAGVDATPTLIQQFARIWASLYLAPTLLAAGVTTRLPWPGGCQIDDLGRGVAARIWHQLPAALRRRGRRLSTVDFADRWQGAAW